MWSIEDLFAIVCITSLGMGSHPQYWSGMFELEGGR